VLGGGDQPVAEAAPAGVRRDPDAAQLAGLLLQHPAADAAGILPPTLPAPVPPAAPVPPPSAASGARASRN
jgi:hypothetical protein